MRLDLALKFSIMDSIFFVNEGNDNHTSSTHTTLPRKVVNTWVLIFPSYHLSTQNTAAVEIRRAVIPPQAVPILHYLPKALPIKLFTLFNKV